MTPLEEKAKRAHEAIEEMRGRDENDDQRMKNAHAAIDDLVQHVQGAQPTRVKTYQRPDFHVDPEDYPEDAAGAGVNAEKVRARLERLCVEITLAPAGLPGKDYRRGFVDGCRRAIALLEEALRGKE